MEVETTPTSPALVTSLEQTSLDSEDQPSPSCEKSATDMVEENTCSEQIETEIPGSPVKSSEPSPTGNLSIDHNAIESDPTSNCEPCDDEKVQHVVDSPLINESPPLEGCATESDPMDLHKRAEETSESNLDGSEDQCFRPAINDIRNGGTPSSDVPLQLTNRPVDNMQMQEGMCSPELMHRDNREELDLSMSNHEPQNLSLSQSPGLCAEDLHQRHMMEESSMMEQPEDLHQHSLQHHYAQQHCHMQYQHHLQKLASQSQQLQNHLRDPHRLHDYDDTSPHPHLLGDQRHLTDGLSDHPLSHNDRSHDGYWNMTPGVISKIKSESKEWFDEGDEMMSDSMSGSMKSDPHASYYRSSPHSNMSAELLSGGRPPSMPHGGLPFSQADHRCHYQSYMGQHGIRDMSPMSPGFAGHQRQVGSHHNTSQHSTSQHYNIQHGTNQIPSMQQGHQTNHIQQFPNQSQYNNQHMALTHGQQIPAPYHQNLPSHLQPGLEGRDGRSERDPYSFVDESTGAPPRPVEEILGQAPKRRGRKPKHIKLMENGGHPDAIAAAQAAHEAKKRRWRQLGPDGKLLPLTPRPRKRIDRFDGIPEDELSRKTLPDHLTPNLDIVIIGINPGLLAAYKGHHYAGPGNHFWKCLYLSGLIPEPLSSDDDSQLLEHGIGFTNIVSRTTKGSAELTRKEIKEGGQILLSKLQRFKPKIAVFNGKGIYEIFSGKKDFSFGRQPEKIEGTPTHVWVMPSSSARCAQLPRALDKVPFYTALRRFRDFLKGTVNELNEEEIVTLTTKPRSIKNECDKIDPNLLADTLGDPYIDEPTLTEPCESEADSDEISHSISQSLFKLAGISREQLENMQCATIPIRKKRGRPKKTPEDPNAPRPKPRQCPTDLMLCNGEEPPRKKRGRPKKLLEDGSTPPPKRPGRKPKALKEVLASQPMSQNNLQAMSMNPLNGMMPPTGYSSTGGPFSPHYGANTMHSMNGPPLPGMSPGLPVNNHSGMNHSNTRGLPLTNNISSGPLPSMHGGSLHPPMCNTPNSNNAHALNQLPPRVNTPKPYGHSPGYSPGTGSVSHQINQPYSHPSDKSDMQSVDDHDLGLSPPPCGSPGMVQPDFEPPTSLPESESMVPSDLSTRGMNPQDESQLSMVERQRQTPSMQSQFSNPGTPADETYQNYQSYTTGKPCSPYNSNVPVVPSPSYSRTVSHSPSYPPSVSRSPSYTSNNTHSPCHTNLAQSPSYPQNSTNSPSYHRNATQSPNYPPSVSRSPSYPSASNHSPSFATTTQSPSCSSMTRSPPYSNSLTHSPSYLQNNTHSPSYRPSMSHSPSFSSNTGTIAKPLLTGATGQPAKGDVSSKSISGLESLVDQIPSLSGDGDHLANPGASLSNPVTPGPPNVSAPFSPPQGGPYQGFGGPNTPYAPHYGSPQASSHPYSPHYSSGSTNLSTNFSVSSLANSSITTSLSYSSGYEGQISSNTTASNAPASSLSSLSVSSMTGDSSTPSSLYNNNVSYSPLPIGAPSHNYSEIMNPSTVLPPTPPMGFMGSSGLPPSMPGSMGSSFPSSMPGSQLPYPYAQYGESTPGYGSPGSGFPYTPSGPGFHLSHRFPYPYTGAPYSHNYPQSSVLDRIKQPGMGFGGF